MADDGEGDGGAGEAVVCLRFLCGALVTEAALGLEFPGKPPHSNDVRPVQMCSICQRKTRNKHVLRVVRSCSCRWRRRNGRAGASRMLLVLSLALAPQCLLIFADLRANVVSLELSKPALALLQSSGANKPAGVPASL